MGTSDSGEDFGIGSLGSALVLQAATDDLFPCFTVLIDGKRAGVILRGNSERYPLAPGDHDLVVYTGTPIRSRWINYRFSNAYYSRRTSFVVKTDEDCEITCGSHPVNSNKIWLVGASIGANGIFALGEIQNALFPQHHFGMGNGLDALIVGLISGLTLVWGRLIVYWPDGTVWCKLK